MMCMYLSMLRHTHTYSWKLGPGSVLLLLAIAFVIASHFLQALTFTLDFCVTKLITIVKLWYRSQKVVKNSPNF